ncbi:MAG: aldo/keto reductase [Acidimicrobiia bacterium]|nr:aldo/keto reductase [Acidimicrobiia bacterium]
MERRQLGPGGPLVSVIGLGTAALGRPGYINLGHGEDFADATSVEAMRANAWRVLDAARAAGVTYVDAARSYGRAEEFVGGWLRDRGISAGEVTIGSKWGYVYTADWRVDADQHEVKIHTRENLDRQIAETRSLLGRSLRLYQIHSATLDSGVLDRPDVLERLGELKADGLVIGASTSGPNQGATIDRLLEVEVDGALLFGTVQSTWNLLEPSSGAALGRAHEAGLGVIVKEAVANGRLTARSPDLAAVIAEATEVEDADTVAIAAAVHQPWATVVLSGASTVDQLDSNLGALSIPGSLVDGLEGELAEDAAVYWATRAQLPWQ